MAIILNSISYRAEPNWMGNGIRSFIFASMKYDTVHM